MGHRNGFNLQNTLSLIMSKRLIPIELTIKYKLYAFYFSKAMKLLTKLMDNYLLNPLSQFGTAKLQCLSKQTNFFYNFF
jgi:hypothetical protein